MFKTENFWDKVIIDGVHYSGDKNVNQIVSTNFTVEFLSDGSITDEGFILNWSCTQWGEWTQLEGGICYQQRRPINNGTDTVGNFKYRKSANCGMFIKKRIFFLFFAFISCREN